MIVIPEKACKYLGSIKEPLYGGSFWRWLFRRPTGYKITYRFAFIPYRPLHHNCRCELIEIGKDKES